MCFTIEHDHKKWEETTVHKVVLPYPFSRPKFLISPYQRTLNGGGVDLYTPRKLFFWGPGTRSIRRDAQTTSPSGQSANEGLYVFRGAEDAHAWARHNGFARHVVIECKVRPRDFLHAGYTPVRLRPEALCTLLPVATYRRVTVPRKQPEIEWGRTYA